MLSEIKSLFEPMAVDGREEQMKFIRLIKLMDQVELTHHQAASKSRK